MCSSAYLPITRSGRVESSRIASRLLESQVNPPLTHYDPPQVLVALELARIMQDIKGGKAPEGLLTSLKTKLGKHIKENYYLYQKELEQEIANIERIQALKQQMYALAGSLLISVFIGISNFASRYAYFDVMGKNVAD